MSSRITLRPSDLVLGARYNWRDQPERCIAELTFLATAYIRVSGSQLQLHGAHGVWLLLQ